MLQFMSAESQKPKMEQFNREREYAIKSQQHLWVAVQSHVLTAKRLETYEDGPLLMDNETLRSIGVGCFICQETFEPVMLKRKCKGEPR